MNEEVAPGDYTGENDADSRHSAPSLVEGSPADRGRRCRSRPWSRSRPLAALAAVSRTGRDSAASIEGTHGVHHRSCDGMWRNNARADLQRVNQKRATHHGRWTPRSRCASLPRSVAPRGRDGLRKRPRQHHDLHATSDSCPRSALGRPMGVMNPWMAVPAMRVQKASC